MSSLSSSSQVNRDAVTSIDSAPKASLRGKNSGNASDNDQFEREARQMESTLTWCWEHDLILMRDTLSWTA